MLYEIDWVLDKLAWMREHEIWPNGKRYLWTDAFGVVLLVSLYEELGDEVLLDRAQWVVGRVDRVLGRARGIRIGEAPDRDGQYYHYLTMWMYALEQLGRHLPEYHDQAVALVGEIHRPFVTPGRGVNWKMTDDLSSPYPGYGYGVVDAFLGYAVYRQLDEDESLSQEIEEMAELVEKQYRDMHVTQDLALGLMLWASHFYPEERWAQTLCRRALTTLDAMWIDPPGYFARQPHTPTTKFRFTNYGVSVGLQSVGEYPDRVRRLNAFCDHYTSGDEYDTEAITFVMGCNSHFPGRLIQPTSAPRKTLERPRM